MAERGKGVMTKDATDEALLLLLGVEVELLQVLLLAWPTAAGAVLWKAGRLGGGQEVERGKPLPDEEDADEDTEAASSWEAESWGRWSWDMLAPLEWWWWW